MSEKPFWEGKTCEEMANLHVKVTFVAGAVLTGITDCSGHIRRSRNGSVVPISANRGAERFVPYRDIESIELVDDPKYERIDNIEDVHAGDIFVAKSGNRYDIRCVDPRRGRPVFGVSIEGEVREWIGSKSFAYALRLKLRLPDEPGLWLDKDDNTWVMGENAFPLTCIDAGNWSITRPQFSTDSVQVLNAAPFRLAKAVEA